MGGIYLPNSVFAAHKSFGAAIGRAFMWTDVAFDVAAGKRRVNVM